MKGVVCVVKRLGSNTGDGTEVGRLARPMLLPAWWATCGGQVTSDESMDAECGRGGQLQQAESGAGRCSWSLVCGVSAQGLVVRYAEAEARLFKSSNAQNAMNPDFHSGPQTRSRRRW